MTEHKVQSDDASDAGPEESGPGRRRLRIRTNAAGISVPEVDVAPDWNKESSPNDRCLSQ